MNTSPEQNILSPSQVGQYLNGVMGRDRLLSRLLVQGEISNYNAHPSGHHFFTLKDRDGALQCVMFRSSAASLRFRLKDGMQVIAAGRVEVYLRSGQYRLNCLRITPNGVGDLAEAYEQLKEELRRRGFFDAAHKKPIPRMPGRIALVTSPAGAAVRDMLRIIGARWPMTQVYVLPVQVQGIGAAEQIAAAIQWANRYQVADLIIAGRGGGSIEDLWAFNEEVVAKAIYDSEIPVISAVGHEPDVTIADFVADRRAATPSNAAELAVPDQNEVYAALIGAGQRMEQAVRQRLAQEGQRLERLSKSRVMTAPEAYFQDKRAQLDLQGSRLRQGLERSIAVQRERFARLAAGLDAMSPLKVLGRGYAIAQRENGAILTSVQGVVPGEQFTLRLADGSLACRVEKNPGAAISPDLEGKEAATD